MRPADAYRLKSGGSASQTIDPEIEPSNVDSLPDELLARILSPVDLKSLVQARAVCKSWKASVEGKAVSNLRANTTEPLIALIGGQEWDAGERSRKMSLRIGRDGAWFDGPPMPEARRNHSVAAVGHKIYVVGGAYQRTTFPTGPPEPTLVYDVWTATWSELPSPQRLRHNAVAVALPDGRILLAGGDDGLSDETRSCEIFDPAEQSWSYAAPMRHLRKRAAGALLDGRVYVVGGSGYGVQSATMEIYDPAADRWDFGPPWGPEPYRADAPKMGCAAAVGGRLYVFAGHSCYIYTPGSEPSDINRRIEAEARYLYGPNAYVNAEGKIVVGDGPPPSPAPTFLRRVPKRDVRRIHTTRGVDDDTGLFRAVEVRGTRGRIIGDAGVRCAQGDDNEGTAGPFDILVTDDLVGDEREWQKTWWRSVLDESMMEYVGCTCAVVGREILIFGGPNEMHAESDDLDQILDRFQIMGNDRPEMLEYAQQRFMNEASDTIFDTGRFPRLATPECGFRRWGERLAAQSEGAAAAVVYV